MRAVILAGGKGTRLLPYTTVLPKPLMPIGDQAIVEILIRQLRYHGFQRITVALGHLAHLVQALLGNGEKLGVKIDYSVEDVPLGTSGPLALIRGLDETFLVANGDVLTDINLEKMLRFHREQGAVATIATHCRRVDINYGVIHRDGFRVVRYDEKPVINYEVSLGIYIFDPLVLEHVPPGRYLDFPDLVTKLLQSGATVCSYPYEGVWFDLGRVEDFQAVHSTIDALREQIPFFDCSPQATDLRSGQAGRRHE